MDVAILAVCPTWGLPDEVASVLASRHDALQGALADRIAPSGGRIAGTDGELILAVVPSVSDALWAAFDLSTRGRGVCLGLAWGASESLASPEFARARRIAWRAAPGVRCTAAFRSALGTVPVGVGLFRVPHDLEHRLGFEAHELSDYRA